VKIEGPATSPRKYPLTCGPAQYHRRTPPSDSGGRSRGSSAERGLCEARISDIATRIGTRPALILYYFPSKDALLTPLSAELVVQPMAPRGVELAIGLVRDELFGPILVIAAGGVMIELLADRVTAVPPSLWKRPGGAG
jgi:hypothetical protein